MRILWSVLAIGSLLCNIARAEKPDETPNGGADAAAARELFIEARKLAADGKYPAACPKFEEAQRLQPGIGSLLNLADCWEHLGRTASAWARYLDVAALAARAGQEDREQIARSRVAELEPQLARLTLHVATQTDLLVTRDGVEVRGALWESATPVDPGDHVIEASAPGKIPWRRVIAVSRGEHAELVVPELVAETPPAAVSPPPVQAEQRADARPRAQSAPWERTVGYAVGGAGVLAIGVGVWAALSYQSANKEALSLCVRSACQSPTELEHHASLVNTATRDRNLSLVAFAVGAGALTGGTWLLLTARRSAYPVALGASPGVMTIRSTW